MGQREDCRRSMLHATAVRPRRIFDLGFGRSHSVPRRTVRRQVRRCNARNADLYLLRPTGPIGFVVSSECAATAWRKVSEVSTVNRGRASLHVAWRVLAPRLIYSEAKRFGEEYRGGDGVGGRKLSLCVCVCVCDTRAWVVGTLASGCVKCDECVVTRGSGAPCPACDVQRLEAKPR